MTITPWIMTKNKSLVYKITVPYLGIHVENFIADKKVKRHG